MDSHQSTLGHFFVMCLCGCDTLSPKLIWSPDIWSPKIGPQLIGPSVRTVPNQFCPPGQMVPNQLCPPRQMVPRILRLSSGTRCDDLNFGDQIGWGPFVQGDQIFWDHFSRGTNFDGDPLSRGT